MSCEQCASGIKLGKDSRVCVVLRAAMGKPRCLSRKEIRMSVMVSEQLCVGCGQCEPVCPEKVVRVWGIARVEEERCTECLVCLGFCPIKGALEVRNA